MKIEWLIIDRSLDGKLSKAEQEKLDRWLAESPVHVEMYERIKARRYDEFSEQKLDAWREEFIARKEKIYRRSLRRVWIKRLTSVAALMAVGIGVYLFQRTVPEPEQKTLVTNYIAPDRSKVHLTTASGEIIEVASLGATDTLWVDKTLVKKEEQMLNYQMLSADSLAEDIPLAENTITVPRGAEFSLQLSDGTRVWLNSDSHITYPVAFSGASRKVTFSGEAYFEVAPDARHPFIVEVDGMAIKVLGTEFNVNTRSQRQIRTVLVKGKVGIATEKGKEVVLKPGELAQVDAVDGKVCVAPVRVKSHVAWRYGEFDFENATVEQILGELALWYDLDVVYQNELVKQEAFSGCLSRDKTVHDILHFIEKTTYVRFTIEGNRVFVNALAKS